MLVGNVCHNLAFVNMSKTLVSLALLHDVVNNFFPGTIFSGPTSGLRAVRILHDLDVAGKRLVAKVDAKNKLLLDNYKEEETRKLGSASRSNLEAEKKDDEAAMANISQILLDHKDDIDNFETIQEGNARFKSNLLQHFL